MIIICCPIKFSASGLNPLLLLRHGGCHVQEQREQLCMEICLGGIRRDADARALEEWSHDRREVSIRGLLSPQPTPSPWAPTLWTDSVTGIGSFCLCPMMTTCFRPGRREDVSPPWEDEPNARQLSDLKTHVWPLKTVFACERWGFSYAIPYYNLRDGDKRYFFQYLMFTL